MVSQHLKNFFDYYIKLDIQVWENFSNLGEVVALPKNTILKESYSKEKYLNFLIEGSGGNLIWKQNNYVCIDLAFKNSFLQDYMSFTLQKSTPIEVRLFEKSTILRIHHREFQETFDKGNFGEKISRLVTEASFISKQQQQIDLLTKPVKDRYIEIMNLQKNIHQIPLKYLASYLGITPQSLSRIRSGKI